jgi:hypothetical protein
VKLALDASVLLTVFNQEPGAEDWMEVFITVGTCADTFLTSPCSDLDLEKVARPRPASANRQPTRSWSGD